MKIGICGNFALESLAHELDRIAPSHEIIVGRAGAFREELGEALGEFATIDPCIIGLDWRDLTPDLYAFAPGDDAEKVVSAFGRVCNDLQSTIERYRTVNKARILLFSPISDGRGAAGFINRVLPVSPFELFGECQRKFNELCRSVVDLYPVDVEEISCRIGKDNAFDAHARYAAGQPFSGAMTEAVARHLSCMCTQFVKYPLKCLVLDLDNTLWGGIAGEDGLGNVALGDSGPGRAYREFQAEIVKLYKQGVLLAVCSKNNTCDALDIMEHHPHMLIRPRMISSFRINWEDKPKNVAGIAEELKIGTDALMFVDDTAAEREMMRRVLPEVEILDLPDDPARFAECLRRCTRFWPVQISEDDAARSGFFTHERARKRSLVLAANVEEYLANCGIVVKIARADADSFPRIAQLFNKTNQFNLTTIRYSQGEIEELARDRDNHLFQMHMTDKYGDYGMVACALIVHDTIDSFILSCRAFGKQAETALLIYVMKHLKEIGLRRVFGRYVPSPKNSMTKEFYAKSGFLIDKSGSGECLWRFDLEKGVPEFPRWINVNAPL